MTVLHLNFLWAARSDRIHVMTRSSETDNHARLRKSSTWSQYSSERNLHGPQIQKEELHANAGLACAWSVMGTGPLDYMAGG